jgi:membrane protein DedA with SNARE-associated domain
MLSTRSKILITVAAVPSLIVLVGYSLSAGSWASEPEAEDWYIGWIVLGVLLIVAVSSIVIDVRRNRMSS